jgi:hypothetical protein
VIIRWKGPGGTYSCLFLGWEEGRSIDGDGKSVDERVNIIEFFQVRKSIPSQTDLRKI